MATAENNRERSINTFLTFGRWVTVISITYGAMSFLAGAYCMMSPERFWYGCAIPLVVGGIVFMVFGMRAHKFGYAIQKLRTTPDDDGISRMISDQIIRVVPSLRKLMNVITIGVVAGICLLIPACVLKWPFVTGLGTALSLQSGLIAMGLMFIIFRCEICLHELERGERSS